MGEEGEEKYVLVFDCGSTNLKVVAVNENGCIVTYRSLPNESVPQSGSNPDWLIWDLDAIWRKLCLCAREVCKELGGKNIGGVIVATWGADGAPVNRDGSLTYPPISWQCNRTNYLVRKLEERISPWEVFQITGYQPISFNTLYKMIWLRENAPEALDEAYCWLMMPGLITSRLTGGFHIDPTSASTTMAMNLQVRDWSDLMLDLAGLDRSFFPEWCEPGEIVGYVTDKAERDCSIPSGVPVLAGGHDTQFAIFGSGAREKEAILSSGTWEILGIRMDRYHPTREAFEEGLVIEADAQDGFWNPQLLMMGSGVLEWAIDKIFQNRSEQKYEAIIAEASSSLPGSEGILFLPSFVKESGPTKKYGVMGSILGLTLRSSRSQIIRSIFEGLSYQLRYALDILRATMGLEIVGIRVVGGGSKNPLWNQIRADVTGLPIIVPEEKEYTALGAAMLAFLGLEWHSSTEQLRETVSSKEKVFEPGENRDIYERYFERYLDAIETLRYFYHH
ncbi:MAG: FGGY family carbohydrate kinase [Nitrososphaerota archaeon]|nr:FGGY family carbohydrate kinase [Candidatus Bathyarchaeota archaeon]MDW8048417.1 FGGY family carbohydrate kinase [Nitrososphaerota archaeon]